MIELIVEMQYTRYNNTIDYAKLEIYLGYVSSLIFSSLHYKFSVVFCKSNFNNRYI